jgi:integrase
MGGTNDPNGYRDEYYAELRRLDDLEYETDADTIRTWAKESTNDYSTRANQMCNVRTLSQRAHAGGFPALTEMESESDFYALHETLHDGSNPNVKDGGLKYSTLRNIRKSAVNFFRDGVGVDWAEEIEIGGPEPTKVTEDDIYVAAEVEALFDAAQNPRDKALMATLLATGQRISAVLSLRIRDVDLNGSTGFIYLNDEAIGLKGAAGKRPLLWATEYVKNWLDLHPCSDSRDAAVFCVVEGQSHPHRDSPADPMSPWGVNQQLRRIGTRAGIDKPVNPHNFRHSAVTRMVRDGVPEQQIKWMVGWKPDSAQFERYTHLTDDEMVAAMLEHYDIAESESDIGRPGLETCISCDAALDAWVNPVACPGCGLSLSHSSTVIANAIEQVHDDATEEAIESTDPDLVEAFQAIREATNNDDPRTLVQAFADALDATEPASTGGEI